MGDKHQYVVVGAGLAGVSAVEGIRERDPSEPIVLIGSEPDLPYDRPPLTKQLWFGKKKLEQIFLHDRAWYDANNVELLLGRSAVRVDTAAKLVTDDLGNPHGYEKLLLATGGTPRRLPIPGGDLEGLCYYRTLADYRQVLARAQKGRSAVIIGGGFIGSELAAALSHAGAQVTMVFPEPHLGRRVFPEPLGRFLQQAYRERGIQVLSDDVPTSFQRQDGRLLTNTRAGAQLVSDVVVAGIGIQPDVALAQAAGLKVGDGVVANDRLQSSDPDVYVAGDNAFFPYAALARSMRVEHWDNALNQGKHAGRNMAGADEAFTYMPYFYSDLFEFGYEAVGLVDTRLETFADWKEENRRGVIYYLADGRVRGAMMCNVWDKVEAARQLIRANAKVGPGNLRGAIR